MLASLLLASSLSAPVSPQAVAPPSRYYMILFGGQSVPFIPRTAHTWATFVKVTWTPTQITVEPRTISWIPEDGQVRIFNPLPVRGKNCTLDETFEIMARHRARVSYWGPYEIDAERFERAVKQIDRLRSGKVSYRLLDSFCFDTSVCHCAHAVTYADPVMKWLVQPVVRVGEPGTSWLAALYSFSGAFIGGEMTHDWLIPVLQIDKAGAMKRKAGEWIPREWW